MIQLYSSNTKGHAIKDKKIYSSVMIPSWKMDEEDTMRWWQLY